MNGFKAASVWPFKCSVSEFLPVEVFQTGNSSQIVNYGNENISNCEMPANSESSELSLAGLSDEVLSPVNCVSSSHERTTPLRKPLKLFGEPLTTPNFAKENNTLRTKRTQAEHGYIITMPSPKKKIPADFDTSSDDDTDAVILLNDSSEEEPLANRLAPDEDTHKS